MIIVNGSRFNLEGKASEICGELVVIFNALYEELGEIELRTMVKTALDIVLEENKTKVIKEQIKNKKELEKKLKQNLPEELANILCSLL